MRSKKNDSIISGSKSSRERKTQPIRTVNDRFYERPTATNELGPGEYEIFSDFVKRVKLLRKKY